MYTPKTEYVSERLSKLIEIANSSQWSPDTAIDWKTEIVLPKEVDTGIYIDMVSQLYYAEEATINLLGRLIQFVPDLQAKQYLCTQAVEEARHLQVYHRYLEKLGDISPINDGLKILLDKGNNWNGSLFALILALNVLMEGEAINQQNLRIKTLPCPLFCQINKTIVRDEARHTAFGKIYLKDKLPLVNAEEKYQIVSWLKNLWQLWTKANEGRYMADGGDILKVKKTDFPDRWGQQVEILSKIGLV